VISEVGSVVVREASVPQAGEQSNKDPAFPPSLLRPRVLPHAVSVFLRAILFPGWCLLVGAAIFMHPRALHTLVFHTGYAAAIHTQRHRLAFYAQCAAAHAGIFVGAVIAVAIWDVGVGFALAAVVISRTLSVWWSYKVPSTGDGLAMREQWEEDIMFIFIVFAGRENEYILHQ